MKLSELFPDRPTIGFGDKEYKMEFTAFSEMLLENEYGSYSEFSAKARKMAESLMKMAIDTIKQNDVINFLVAGLIHTELLDKFVDKSRYPWEVDIDAAKAYLATIVYRRDFPAYISIITQSFSNSMISKEMQETLNVLAAQVQAEKKTQETTEPHGLETTPTIPVNVDEVTNGSGTLPAGSE